ncbi:MAG: hypothetical protein P8Y78_12315 [Acidihalobacter sp.]
MAESAGYRSPWYWGPPSAALLLAAAVALSGSNVALFHWFNAWPAWSGNMLWADLTVLGDTVFVFALLLPWWRRRPDIVYAAFLAAVPATLWVDVLKPLIDSPRPAAVLGASAIHVIGPVLTARSSRGTQTEDTFSLLGFTAAVEDELRVYLRGTFLEGSPILPVSSVTARLWGEREFLAQVTRFVRRERGAVYFTTCTYTRHAEFVGILLGLSWLTFLGRNYYCR